MRGLPGKLALLGATSAIVLPGGVSAQTPMPNFQRAIQFQQLLVQQQAATSAQISALQALNQSQVNGQFKAFVNDAISKVQAIAAQQQGVASQFQDLTKSAFEQFQQQAASQGAIAPMADVSEGIERQQVMAQEQSTLSKFKAMSDAVAKKNNEYVADEALRKFEDSEDAKHAQQDLEAKILQMGDGAELSDEADQTAALISMENPNGDQQRTAEAMSALQQVDALDRANVQAMLDEMDGGDPSDAAKALEQADSLDRQNAQTLKDAINGVSGNPNAATQALEQMNAADRANAQKILDQVGAPTPSLQQTIDANSAAIQDLLRQVQTQNQAMGTLDRNLKTLLDQGDLSDGAEADILDGLGFDSADADDALRDQLQQQHDAAESAIKAMPLVDGLDNTMGSDLVGLAASIQKATAQLAANPSAYEDSDLGSEGSYGSAQLQSIYQGYDPSLHGFVLQSPELQIAGPSLVMPSPDLQPAGPSLVMMTPTNYPAGSPSDVMESLDLQPALCGR